MGSLHQILLLTVLLGMGLCVTALVAPAPLAVAPIASTGPEVRDLAPAAPAGALFWRHEHCWTVSSDDVLFHQLVRARIDGQDRITVADRGLLRLLTFDRSGTLVRRLDLEGEGPGTVRTLVDFFVPDDSSLVVVQNWPGRLIVLTDTGAPRHTVDLAREPDGGFLGLACFDQRDGTTCGTTVHFQEVEPDVQRTTTALAVFDGELRPVHDILRRTVEDRYVPHRVDETVGYFPTRAWAVAADGAAVVAPDREAYRLEIRDLRGRVQRVLRRNLPAPRRSDDEIRQLKAGFQVVENGVVQDLEFRLFPTAELIQEIVTLDDGLLLVRTAYEVRDLPAGATARFDLVDPDRVRIAEVHVAVPYDSRRDVLWVLPTRDLVIVRRGQPGVADTEAPALEYWSWWGGEG